MGEGQNRSGNSRRWIRYEVEQSLRRLGTDWIDLYQIHRPDPRTDIEETLSVLTDLIREGKVRAIGCSTFPAELIVEAHWAAERRGLERFRCEQPPYSLFARGIEAGVLPVCERYGMGVITWSPLAGGWLTGRYRHGEEIDLTSGRASRIPQRFDPSLPANQRKLDLVEQLETVAAEAGVLAPHLALAFVVCHPAVTSAIIGPRTMEQLKDLLAGVEVVLDDATLDRLDEIVPPGLTVNPADAGWQSEALTEPWRRRRRPEGRARRLSGAAVARDARSGMLADYAGYERAIGLDWYALDPNLSHAARPAASRRRATAPSPRSSSAGSASSSARRSPPGPRSPTSTVRCSSATTAGAAKSYGSCITRRGWRTRPTW